MKTVKDYPPNIEDIRRVCAPKSNTIYTYGETIFNPNGGFIDKHLLAHEATHTKQQGNDPASWWKRYLVDTDFRFVQELEAYQVQYQSYCQEEKDKNKRVRFLARLAYDLASPVYGSICKPQEAREAISSGIEFQINKMA